MEVPLDSLVPLNEIFKKQMLDCISTIPRGVHKGMTLTAAYYGRIHIKISVASIAIGNCV